MALCPFNRKNGQATLFKAQKSLTNGILTFQQGEGPNYSILSPNRQSNGILSFRQDEGSSYFELDNRRSMVPYPSDQIKGSDYSIPSPTNQLQHYLKDHYVHISNKSLINGIPSFHYEE
ncbi:hypothetical protein KY284_032196 [Solanum tuberosum]|nr:hypothetical protein KY284_032196 [Solanum tuberosum]